MKLLTFSKNGEAKVGALVGDRVLDLGAVAAQDGSTGSPGAPALASMEDIVANPATVKWIKSTLEKQSADAGPWLALEGMQLLPPLQRPPKVLCVARNYADHAKEAGLEISPIPILFARFANTLVGHQAPVKVPSVSPQLDWEGEIAVIVGKGTNGKRVSKAEAMDYVFGYSIFNDITVRDFQFRIPQYTAGKNFRTSGPFGPYILTADEPIDPHNLALRTLLNGEVMQSDNTSSMLYDIPTVIENIAEFIDLEPGDVIPMGTPAGVGFKRKPPIFMKDGDVISVEVENIGVLTNPVVDE